MPLLLIIHGKIRTRTIDENIHNGLSLRPRGVKELDKIAHLNEVIKRLHPLDTIPHPVLVLFIKIKQVRFESGVGPLTLNDC